MSGAIWSSVAPLLATTHRVYAPTAIGHRGGVPAPTTRPVSLHDVVEDAERILDQLGLEKPHLAGNSMGGWVAIELAKRGRATSVCALSPAGMWDVGSANHHDALSLLRRDVATTRIGRRVAPLALRVPAIRRFSLRHIASHADRIAPAQALSIADDLLHCTVTSDLLSLRDGFDQQTTLPCPITLAWSAEDRVFPVQVNGSVARSRLPGASFTVLRGVGHVPMLDDPELVAETIRATLVETGPPLV